MTNTTEKSYLFIDLSYFIFHTYYAKKKYFEYMKEPLEDLINNEKFLSLFSNFDSKICLIIKKLKLPKNTIVIYGKDCKRTEIWRNELYPNYKKSRKTDDQIKDFFIYTYKNIISTLNVLENENCEADDVIAVSTRHIIKTEPYSKVNIITGDHDYLQLLENDNINIYDLKLKSLRLKSTGDCKIDLMLKILMGDTSDNILPIHKKLGIKTALKYVENPEKLKEKCSDETIKNTFELNKTLIDFNNIPDKYKLCIVHKFKQLLN